MISKPVATIVLLLSLLTPTIGSANIDEIISEGKKILESSTATDYKKLLNIATYLMDEDIYFAAIPFVKEALYTKSENNKYDEHLDAVIDKMLGTVGVDQFSNLPIKLLQKSSAPNINLLIAKMLFHKGQYDQALQHLAKVPDNHDAYSNALVMKAHIHSIKKEFEPSIEAYKGCIKYAEKTRSKFDDVKHLERTYQFVKDSCTISIARVLYKAQRFKESSSFYRSIPKTSYKWPSILLEDAWNSYRLKDYNRSIGRLLTFKSPILNEYFFPEAEVLKAMGYIELCLWDDAIEVIKEYQKLYAPNGTRLIAKLTEPNLDKHFFVRLSLDDKHPAYQGFPFLKNSMEYIKTGPYFLSSMHHLRQFSKEYKMFKTKLIEYQKRKINSEFAKVLLYNLKESKNDQIELVNQYVKKSLYDMANEISRTSGELLAIHLEAFSRKKEQIFKTKDIMSRERGNLKAINRGVDQYFWTFKQEFWADELGDYVLALESECTNNKM